MNIKAMGNQTAFQRTCVHPYGGPDGFINAEALYLEISALTPTVHPFSPTKLT